MDKYQVMPPLAEQEYQELKNSIAQYGVQVAVEYDEEGTVLDGHHRLQACKELGISVWPKIVKSGMDENQKMNYALTVNVTRRQLSREQKQELIRQQLRRTPEKSDRQIAGIVGTDHKTVGNQRDLLTGRGEIPHTKKTIDTLGREQPRHTKTVDSSTRLNPDNCGNTTPQGNHDTVNGRINTTQQGKSYLCQVDQCVSQPTELGSEIPKQDKLIGTDDQLRQQGCDKKFENYFREDDEDRREILINNTHKAFYTICEKVSYLKDDYSNIAWCLLAAGNTKTDLVEDVSRCIDRLQNIKAALCKKDTKILQVVK